MKLAWPALRSRNFRLFLAGQALALLGNSVQQVALGWLIYRTSGSSMILGVMGFAGGLPAAALSPFAGVLADRTDPRRILLSTQLLSTLQALLFAVLVYLDHAAVPAIVTLIFAKGILDGIDRPVRQMFVARLLDRKEDISSAVASGALVYDGARMIGPALGGLVLAWFSEAPSFFLNALCQAAAVALLLSLRVPPRPPDPGGNGVMETLWQGVRYAMGARAVRTILLLSACISFAGSSYMVLLPVMAADVVKGGPHALGYLLSAVGAGAIAGGLLFGIRDGIAGHARLVSVGAGLYGSSLLVFSQSSLLALSILALGAAGLGIMVMMTSCSTLLLSTTDPDKHGRVLSLFTLSYLATAPLGSLSAGFLASRFDAPSTIAVNAVFILLAALLLRP